MFGAIKDVLTAAESHPAWVAAVLLATALIWATKQWLKALQDILDLARQFAAAVETSNSTSRELLDRVERIERGLDRVT